MSTPLIRIKHCDTLGYAGYLEDHRLTAWYPTAAEATARVTRLVRNGAKSLDRFREAQNDEREKRIVAWLDSLKKQKNVRIVRRDERHFDKALWTSMQMRRAREAEKAVPSPDAPDPFPTK